PHSREAAMFASMVAILIVLAFIIGPHVASLSEDLSLLIDSPGGFSLANGTDATLLLWNVALSAGRLLLPAIAVLAVAGVIASVFQNAPGIALERVRPQWSRISPLGGWRRVFGTQGYVEFLKSVFKFAAIAVVCLILLGASRTSIINAMFSDPTQIPGAILSLAVRLVSAICVATIVLVAGDLIWARLRWRSDLRMTRQELKDEVKETEGDPLVRGRLRSLQRDRARRRMIAAVPRASVVIANPTHYAVALRYERSEGGAPQVVAKGADLIALRIREIASRHGIPIVEDKPLARALHDAVEVDQWIPPEFYRAVARILYLLHARRPHAVSG
ncbi:MAG: EscU/YscU/HrcU family type III secretion system export apparatus switch protein, partial [Reyranellales bacterium]